MTQIDDGGPAFPAHETPFDLHPGMSVRMWLAGQAMNGILASMDMHERAHDHPRFALASACFSIADALIAAEKDKLP